jgi:hypothetical protein
MTAEQMVAARITHRLQSLVRRQSAFIPPWEAGGKLARPALLEPGETSGCAQCCLVLDEKTRPGAGTPQLSIVRDCRPPRPISRRPFPSLAGA